MFGMVCSYLTACYKFYIASVLMSPQQKPKRYCRVVVVEIDSSMPSTQPDSVAIGQALI